MCSDQTPHTHYVALEVFTYLGRYIPRGRYLQVLRYIGNFLDDPSGIGTPYLLAARVRSSHSAIAHIRAAPSNQ